MYVSQGNLLVKDLYRQLSEGYVAAPQSSSVNTRAWYKRTQTEQKIDSVSFRFVHISSQREIVPTGGRIEQNRLRAHSSRTLALSNPRVCHKRLCRENNALSHMRIFAIPFGENFCNMRLQQPVLH